MHILDNEFIEVIATALECDAKSITPDMGLGKHYKWDSLGHVAIIVAIESKYGIEINDSNIEQTKNYADLKNYIQSNANK